MTAEEKTRFEKMENSVEQIGLDVAEIKSALLGNKLSGEKGLTGQIETLKKKIDDVETELKDLRETRTENNTYVLIIKFLLAAVVLGVINYFFNMK